MANDQGGEKGHSGKPDNQDEAPVPTTSKKTPQGTSPGFSTHRDTVLLRPPNLQLPGNNAASVTSAPREFQWGQVNRLQPYPEPDSARSPGYTQPVLKVSGPSHNRSPLSIDDTTETDPEHRPRSPQTLSTRRTTLARTMSPGQVRARQHSMAAVGSLSLSDLQEAYSRQTAEVEQLRAYNMQLERELEPEYRSTRAELRKERNSDRIRLRIGELQQRLDRRSGHEGSTPRLPFPVSPSASSNTSSAGYTDADTDIDEIPDDLNDVNVLKAKLAVVDARLQTTEDRLANTEAELKDSLTELQVFKDRLNESNRLSERAERGSKSQAATAERAKGMLRAVLRGRVSERIITSSPKLNPGAFGNGSAADRSAGTSESNTPIEADDTRSAELPALELALRPPVNEPGSPSTNSSDIGSSSDGQLDVEQILQDNDILLAELQQKEQFIDLLLDNTPSRQTLVSAAQGALDSVRQEDAELAQILAEPENSTWRPYTIARCYEPHLDDSVKEHHPVAEQQKDRWRKQQAISATNTATDVRDAIGKMFNPHDRLINQLTRAMIKTKEFHKQEGHKFRYIGKRITNNADLADKLRRLGSQMTSLDKDVDVDIQALDNLERETSDLKEELKLFERLQMSIGSEVATAHDAVLKLLSLDDKGSTALSKTDRKDGLSESERIDAEKSLQHKRLDQFYQSMKGMRNDHTQIFLSEMPDSEAMEKDPRAAIEDLRQEFTTRLGEWIRDINAKIEANEAKITGTNMAGKEKLEALMEKRTKFVDILDNLQNPPPASSETFERLQDDLSRTMTELGDAQGSAREAHAVSDATLKAKVAAFNSLGAEVTRLRANAEAKENTHRKRTSNDNSSKAGAQRTKKVEKEVAALNAELEKKEQELQELASEVAQYFEKSRALVRQLRDENTNREHHLQRRAGEVSEIVAQRHEVLEVEVAELRAELEKREQASGEKIREQEKVLEQYRRTLEGNTQKLEAEVKEANDLRQRLDQALAEKSQASSQNMNTMHETLNDQLQRAEAHISVLQGEQQNLLNEINRHERNAADDREYRDREIDRLEAALDEARSQVVGLTISLEKLENPERGRGSQRPEITPMPPRTRSPSPARRERKVELTPRREMFEKMQNLMLMNEIKTLTDRLTQMEEGETFMREYIEGLEQDCAKFQDDAALYGVEPTARKKEEEMLWQDLRKDRQEFFDKWEEASKLVMDKQAQLDRQTEELQRLQAENDALIKARERADENMDEAFSEIQAELAARKVQLVAASEILSSPLKSVADSVSSADDAAENMSESPPLTAEQISQLIAEINDVFPRFCHAEERLDELELANLKARYAENFSAEANNRPDESELQEAQDVSGVLAIELAVAKEKLLQSKMKQATSFMIDYLARRETGHLSSQRDRSLLREHTLYDINSKLHSQLKTLMRAEADEDITKRKTDVQQKVIAQSRQQLLDSEKEKDELAKKLQAINQQAQTVKQQLDQLEDGQAPEKVKAAQDLVKNMLSQLVADAARSPSSRVTQQQRPPPFGNARLSFDFNMPSTGFGGAEKQMPLDPFSCSDCPKQLDKALKLNDELGKKNTELEEELWSTTQQRDNHRKDLEKLALQLRVIKANERNQEDGTDCPQRLAEAEKDLAGANHRREELERRVAELTADLTAMQHKYHKLQGMTSKYCVDQKEWVKAREKKNLEVEQLKQLIRSMDEAETQAGVVSAQMQSRIGELEEQLSSEREKTVMNGAAERELRLLQSFKAEHDAMKCQENLGILRETRQSLETQAESLKQKLTGYNKLQDCPNKLREARNRISELEKQIEELKTNRSDLDGEREGHLGGVKKIKIQLDLCKERTITLTQTIQELEQKNGTLKGELEKAEKLATEATQEFATQIEASNQEMDKLNDKLRTIQGLVLGSPKDDPLDSVRLFVETLKKVRDRARVTVEDKEADLMENMKKYDGMYDSIMNKLSQEAQRMSKVERMARDALTNLRSERGQYKTRIRELEQSLKKSNHSCTKEKEALNGRIRGLEGELALARQSQKTGDDSGVETKKRIAELELEIEELRKKVAGLESKQEADHGHFEREKADLSRQVEESTAAMEKAKADLQQAINDRLNTALRPDVESADKERAVVFDIMGEYILLLKSSNTENLMMRERIDRLEAEAAERDREDPVEIDGLRELRQEIQGMQSQGTRTAAEYQAEIAVLRERLVRLLGTIVQLNARAHGDMSEEGNETEAETETETNDHGSRTGSGPGSGSGRRRGRGESDGEDFDTDTDTNTNTNTDGVRPEQAEEEFGHHPRAGTARGISFQAILVLLVVIQVAVVVIDVIWESLAYSLVAFLATSYWLWDCFTVPVATLGNMALSIAWMARQGARPPRPPRLRLSLGVRRPSREQLTIGLGYMMLFVAAYNTWRVWLASSRMLHLMAQSNGYTRAYFHDITTHGMPRLMGIQQVDRRFGLSWSVVLRMLWGAVRRALHKAVLALWAWAVWLPQQGAGWALLRRILG